MGKIIKSIVDIIKREYIIYKFRDRLGKNKRNDFKSFSKKEQEYLKRHGVFRFLACADVNRFTETSVYVLTKEYKKRLRKEKK